MDNFSSSYQLWQAQQKNKVLSILHTIKTKNENNFWDEGNQRLWSDDINAVIEHNKSYSNILKSYSESLKISSELKIQFKKDFFYQCCLILGLVVLVLVGVVVWTIFRILTYPEIQFNTYGITTVLATLAGTFLTSFIVLPYVISKYLFNTEEEKHLMKVLKIIKAYDLHVRKHIKNGREHKK